MMRDERRDIRELLGQLTAEQWQQPSRCAGWTVRDLVAHLVGWDQLLIYRSPREHVNALARFIVLYASSLGSMKLLNRRIQRTLSHLEPEELAQQFGADDTAELKWLFDGTNPGAHLAEYVIHHEDIRRPLGLARPVPTGRLIAALDGITQLPSVRLSAWRRLRRNTFDATDVDWTAGRRPALRMTADQILTTLAGRSV